MVYKLGIVQAIYYFLQVPLAFTMYKGDLLSLLALLAAREHIPPITSDMPGRLSHLGAALKVNRTKS